MWTATFDRIHADQPSSSNILSFKLTKSPDSSRKNKSRAAALFPILNKYLGVQGQHAFFSTLYANTEYIKLSSFSSLLGMKS